MGENRGDDAKGEVISLEDKRVRPSHDHFKKAAEAARASNKATLEKASMFRQAKANDAPKTNSGTVIRSADRFRGRQPS